MLKVISPGKNRGLFHDDAFKNEISQCHSPPMYLLWIFFYTHNSNYPIIAFFLTSSMYLNSEAGVKKSESAALRCRYILRIRETNNWKLFRGCPVKDIFASTLFFNRLSTNISWLVNRFLRAIRHIPMFTRIR